MASDAHTAALLAGGSTALYTAIQNCLTHSQKNTGKSVLYCAARTQQSCSRASYEREWRYSSTPQTSNLEVSGQLYAPSALTAEKALLVPNKIKGEWALKARMDVLQKTKLFCPYRQSIIYSIVPVVDRH